MSRQMYMQMQAMPLHPLGNPTIASRRTVLRWGLAGGVALSASGLVTACGGDPNESSKDRLRTLSIGYATIGSKPGNPVDIDVIQLGDICALVYEGLITQDPKTLEPRPGLATSFKTVDEKTYRFVIAQDHVFSDGTPVTVGDVKGSLEAYISPEAVDASASNTFAYTPWLDSVRIVDDQTVEVLATKRWRLAMRSMSTSSAIFPAASLPLDLSVAPPGSGPYMFNDVVPNDRIVLVPNPEYVGNHPAAFETITFRVFAEDAPRVAGLQAGDLQYISPAPADALGSLQDAGFTVSSLPSIRNIYLTFNFKNDGPWKDARVRQAMNYAIDKDALNQALYNGKASVSVAPEPPALSWTPKGLPAYTFDVDKARTLLTEAGLPDGFKAGKIAARATDKQLAEAIQELLRNVGVQYDLSILEPDAFGDEALECDLGFASWAAPEGDPAASLYSMIGYQFPWDLGGYEKTEKPELGQAIVAAANIIDPAAAEAAYLDIETTVWNDAPRIFLFETPLVWANDSQVKSFEQSVTGPVDWAGVKPA